MKLPLALNLALLFMSASVTRSPSTTLRPSLSSLETEASSSLPIVAPPLTMKEVVAADGSVQHFTAMDAMKGVAKIKSGLLAYFSKQERPTALSLKKFNQTVLELKDYLPVILAEKPILLAGEKHTSPASFTFKRALLIACYELKIPQFLEIMTHNSDDKSRKAEWDHLNSYYNLRLQDTAYVYGLEDPKVQPYYLTLLTIQKMHHPITSAQGSLVLIQLVQGINHYTELYKAYTKVKDSLNQKTRDLIESYRKVTFKHRLGKVVVPDDYFQDLIDRGGNDLRLDLQTLVEKMYVRTRRVAKKYLEKRMSNPPLDSNFLNETFRDGHLLYNAFYNRNFWSTFPNPIQYADEIMSSQFTPKFRGDITTTLLWKKTLLQYRQANPGSAFVVSCGVNHLSYLDFPATETTIL